MTRGIWLLVGHAGVVRWPPGQVRQGIAAAKDRENYGRRWRMSRVRAAKKAVRELLSLGDHFSFATEKDKSAWLALLLTVAFRKKIRGPVPMFWIVGDPRTGKTTLARYTAQLGALASGRQMPDVKYSQSIGARAVIEAVKERIPVAIIDDVYKPLRGESALCAAISERTITERIFDRKTGKRIWNETVWCAVSTQLTPFASTALKRRTVPIKLVEGPEYDPARNEVLKGDELELQEQAKILWRNTADYLSWHDEGSSRISWTAFEEWSLLIRLPLIAAGMPDPVPSFFEDEESDAATKV